MAPSFGRLILPDDQDDPIVLDIRSSALEFAVCSRAAIGRLGEAWDGVGTYVLIGSVDAQGRVRVYVGKTSRLRTRLSEHVKKKPWWNRAVLLQSKSREGFTTADAAWMEAEVIRRLLVWESVTLENGNQPAELSLSAHEVQWLTGVVDDLFRILYLLGHAELVEITTPTLSDAQIDAVPDVWVVRAGEGGVLMDQFRERGAVRVGFRDTYAADLRGVGIDDLRATGGKASAIGQLVRFRDAIAVGDYVLTPAPGSTSYLVGEVSSEYQYDDTGVEYPHVRKVTWLAEIAATSISEEARRSLGSSMTLFRPNYQEDIRALVVAATSGIAAGEQDGPSSAL